MFWCARPNPIFSRISQPLHGIRIIPRRGLAATANINKIPASLLRLNAGESYKPLRAEFMMLNSHVKSRGVLISELSPDSVWPDLLPFSNGASLMPNTFTMQEIIRTAVDNYYEDVENDMVVERPYIYSIPKGTPLPTTLVLVKKEHAAAFSLQPSQSICIDDFNTIINRFYSQYAEKQEAEEWLDGHPFEHALPDDAERDWMSR